MERLGLVAEEALNGEPAPGTMGEALVGCF